jgi:hypothetical protein
MSAFGADGSTPPWYLRPVPLQVMPVGFELATIESPAEIPELDLNGWWVQYTRAPLCQLSL